MALRLLALLVWLSAAPAGAAVKELIFQLTDPYGDDHGNGRLIYPTARSDLEPGDLDLLGFEALREGEDTIFRVNFARPVRPPGREAIDGLGTSRERETRLGFYTFNLDIYIDTDREPSSGQVAMLPGRRAEVSFEDAWEKLVVLTPRPDVLRSAIQRRKLREWKEEEELKRSVPRQEVKRRKRQIAEELLPLVYFPKQVRVRGRQVEIRVPRGFLGDEARAEWAYVVTVTGALLNQRLGLPFFGKFPEEYHHGMVIPIVPGGDREAFGGGNRRDPLQPPVVDLLLPAGSPRGQGQILDDHDSSRERPAAIPGVVPARIARGDRSTD